ncbi:type II toxin-antitoxin system VapC family toxin [Gulosibacter sp. 10]|uniref:type II toxin-antitoxin system VapC family toxin n=1 Tax=Gulosibacter sp. 10 TaxID=1255570 RepID=UPI00097F65A1|nr:type II toxin-antitoxin system VapC family toxin [Gulosibacter sp. 10]SJM66743.1 VapC toxin protein [Gulosibacter sp. 10]
MIVLDTNVISELFRRQPEARVVARLESLEVEVAITAITLAELFAGVRRLPDGRRKEELGKALSTTVEPYRGGHAVLPFDESCADAYAEILCERERVGLPIMTADAQIAAICRTHEAVCATRDTKAFAYTGIVLVDPWVAPRTGLSTRPFSKQAPASR